MINISKTILFIGLFFYLLCKANAWGLLGHRIVGQIAESYLTPNAKKEITKILGNDIKVSWLGTPTNLHSVWDVRLIDFQQLSYTEYSNAINHTTAVQRSAWQKQPLSEWIWESYLLAQKVYADVKPDDKLGYLYN